MDARVARVKAEKKAKKGSKTVSTETESKSTSNGVHSTEEPSTSGSSSSSSGEVKTTVDLKPKKGKYKIIPRRNNHTKTSGEGDKEGGHIQTSVGIGFILLR